MIRAFSLWSPVVLTRSVSHTGPSPVLLHTFVQYVHGLFTNRGLFLECEIPISLVLPTDARGIHASCSNTSLMMTYPCNLLVHSSSLPMEMCSMVVPGLQRTVSMHGRVIGPILMLEMQGTCCAKIGSWAINPKGSSLSRLTYTCSSKTCEKYGLSRHPFNLVLCRFPEMSTN